MSLAAIGAQSVTSARRLRVLLDVVRLLEDGGDVERATETARLHVVSALTLLMTSIISYDDDDDGDGGSEVSRAVTILRLDLESSVPMISAGVLGAEKLRAIEQACRLLSEVCLRRSESDRAALHRACVIENRE